jgi:hypothetical protein
VRDVSNGISVAELQVAARKHGMPLEALPWDVVPIGLHYLLTHYDSRYIADQWPTFRAAFAIAERPESARSTIVVPLAESGERYVTPALAEEA